MRITTLALALAPLFLIYAPTCLASQIRIETRTALNSRVANVHIEADPPISQEIDFTYGPCSTQTKENAHHVVGQAIKLEDDRPRRLVWIMPKGLHSGDCISGWSETGELLGRSEPQKVQHKKMRRRKRDSSDFAVPMNSSSGIDVYGPWFDGVALLEKSENHDVDVEAAKAKEIAIVGAGMAGLTTCFILNEAGLKNLTILEGSDQLGGRVRTEYLTGGPEDHSYAEMGPMRIPYQTQVGSKTYNISDQALFFQLVDEVNKKNQELGNDHAIVSLIPFIQRSPNSLVYYNGNRLDNGLPPTQADVAANSSLGRILPEIPESAQKLSSLVQDALPDAQFLDLMATNIWQAHADFLGESIFACP